MAKKMYGYDYDPIPTKDAERFIAEDIYEDGKSTQDCEWWHVADLNDSEEMWMDNICGLIIIRTNTDTSYIRFF
jgi:hypothetical protein